MSRFSASSHQDPDQPPKPATNACAVDGFDCFIGVEFEYLVPYIGSQKEDPHPHDSRYVLFEDKELERGRYGRLDRSMVVIGASQHLRRQLRARGIPVVMDDMFGHKLQDNTAEGMEQKREYYRKQAAQQGVVVGVQVAHGSSSAEHCFWHLNMDGSVVHDKDFSEAMRHERYAWYDEYENAAGMELASPVLRSATAAEAIADVLQTLRASLRLVVPRSAGFHVHVSSLAGGVDLLTAKKMLTLVLLCEGVLYQLAAPWRIKEYYAQSIMAPLIGLTRDRNQQRRHDFAVNPDVSFNASFAAAAAAPPSRPHSRPPSRPPLDKLRAQHLAEMLAYVPCPLRSSEKRHEGLATLWQSVALCELRLHVCGVAVKCKDPRPTPDDAAAGLYTVEMRQLEGQVDPETACAWVRLCVALFRIASTYDAERYRAKLAELNHLLDQRYTSPANAFYLYTGPLNAFLAAIGIPDAWAFWQRKKLRNLALPPVEQNARVQTRLVPPLLW